jgi:hypothetical protein
MLGAKKKKPGDYPQFAFRVSKEQKAELQNLIQKAQDRLNARRKSEDDPFVAKNDVIVAALLRGLKGL